MKKKYVYIILILMIMLIFTSITNASFLDYKQQIYEKIQDNPTFQQITDIITNISSYQDKVENILNTTNTNITEEEIPENNESTYYEKLYNNTILGKIITIVSQYNEKFAAILQRVVQNIFSFRRVG
jgi:hypothetical protein